MTTLELWHWSKGRQRHLRLQTDVDWDWLPCRLDSVWVGAGLSDVCPYPLTRPLGFKVAEDAASRPAAPTEAPGQTFTDAQIASGRRWSAKVVLMSGVRASALHATDKAKFQVTVLACLLSALALGPSRTLRSSRDAGAQFVPFHGTNSALIIPTQSSKFVIANS